MKRFVGLVLTTALLVSMLSGMLVPVSAATVTTTTTSDGVDSLINSVAYNGGTTAAVYDKTVHTPQTTQNSGIWSYSVLSENEVTVTEYKGAQSDVVIPDTLDGYTVRAIGAYVFSYDESMRSVSIPVTVTSIGDSAFYGCDELETVYYGGRQVDWRLVEVEDWNEDLLWAAFVFSEEEPTLVGAYPTLNGGVTGPDLTGTTKGNYVYTVLSDNTIELTAYTGSATKLVVPSAIDGYTLSAIGSCAFYNNFALESITLPESVKTIDDYAFWGSFYLADITLPTALTSIGYGAFGNCYHLNSVSVPASVTFIGDGAFAGCDYLTAIDVDNANANYSDINGVLFNKEKTALLAYPANNWYGYSVPEGVTTIGNLAFAGVHIEEVVLPDGVTTIGNGAFSECDQLREVSLPNSVSSIGHWAFSGCECLQSLALPESLHELGAYVFERTALTAVVIPETITAIPQGAFYYCDSLSEITLHDGVSVIGASAFECAYSLTSITIPSGVAWIDHFAFSQCDSLAEVTYTGTKTDWDAVKIGQYNEPLTEANFTALGNATTTTTTATTATAATTSITATTAMPPCDVLFTLETANVSGGVQTGETIELKLTVSELAGLNSVQLCIGYDKTQLELADAQLQGAVDTFDLREIVTSPLESLTDGGELWVTAVSSATSCDVAQDEAILKLTFKTLCAIEDVAQVKILRCDASTVTSVLEDRVLTCVGIDGGITVGDMLLGDVNSDTVVDLDDAVRLFYYVNDMLELTDEERKRADVADPTDDVVVDLDDAVRLFYFVNDLIDLSA